MIFTRVELKAAVISWLYKRSDVETNFDTFVMLTEEALNNGYEELPPLRVDEMLVTEPVVFTSGVGTKPTGFLQYRGQPVDASSSYGGQLRYLTPSGLDRDYPYGAAGASGPGEAFSIQGGNLIAAPNFTGTINLTFYKKITELTNEQPTNDIIVNYPSLYLRGCIFFAADWLKDDSETEKNLKMFKSALAGANKKAFMGNYASARTTLSGPVV